MRPPHQRPTARRAAALVPVFRTIAVAVVAVVVAAALAVLLFRTPGGLDAAAPTPATPAEKEQPETEPRAPALPGATGREVVAEEPVAASGTAPCAGCLDEPAVLEVAEAFLFYVLPDHLGIRAERYLASVPDDIDLGDRKAISDFSRKLRHLRRPALPAGLVGAPRINPFGTSVRFGSNVNRGWSFSEELETWIVWVQFGWRSHASVASLVERGELPEVALSWPPLKREMYILVNARTGEITSVEGIMRGHLRNVDPTGTDLFVPGRDAARKRAAAWFARNRSGG